MMIYLTSSVPLDRSRFAKSAGVPSPARTPRRLRRPWPPRRRARRSRLVHRPRVLATSRSLPRAPADPRSASVARLRSGCRLAVAEFPPDGTPSRIPPPRRRPRMTAMARATTPPPPPPSTPHPPRGRRHRARRPVSRPRCLLPRRVAPGARPRRAPRVRRGRASDPRRHGRHGRPMRAIPPPIRRVPRPRQRRLARRPRRPPLHGVRPSRERRRDAFLLRGIQTRRRRHQPRRATTPRRNVRRRRRTFRHRRRGFLRRGQLRRRRPSDGQTRRVRVRHVHGCAGAVRKNPPALSSRFGGAHVAANVAGVNETALRVFVGDAVRRGAAQGLKLTPVFSCSIRTDPCFARDAERRARRGRVDERRRRHVGQCWECGEARRLDGGKELGGCFCHQCADAGDVNVAMDVSGPMWLGPLHERETIRRLERARPPSVGTTTKTRPRPGDERRRPRDKRPPRNFSRCSSPSQIRSCRRSTTGRTSSRARGGEWSGVFRR